jgi:hypothetical protein
VRHAAGSAIAANDGVRVNFFTDSVIASINFEYHPPSIGVQGVKTAPQLDTGAGTSSFLRQTLNQTAALYDQVGVFQGNRGSAAIGKKLESTNFVDHASFGGPPEQSSHAICDDQRPFLRLQRLNAFEYANRDTLTR